MRRLTRRYDARHMDEPWTILLPLIVANAVLPLQLAVTVLLIRSVGGRSGAFAWVAGMTVVRLLQGLVLGVVLGGAIAGTDTTDRPGPIESTLLLVVGIGFLLAAARKTLRVPDDDAPPPRWMTVVATIRPGRAFLAGVGVVAVSPKLWALTLAATGAIAEAGLDTTAAAGTYLIYAIGAVALHLAILASTVLAPARAEPVIAGLAGALERYDRPLMIALSLIFGVWFLIKALDGFGLLG